MEERKGDKARRKTRDGAARESGMQERLARPTWFAMPYETPKALCFYAPNNQAPRALDGSRLIPPGTPFALAVAICRGSGHGHAENQQTVCPLHSPKPPKIFFLGQTPIVFFDVFPLPTFNYSLQSRQPMLA